MIKSDKGKYQTVRKGKHQIVRKVHVFKWLKVKKVERTGLIGLNLSIVGRLKGARRASKLQKHFGPIGPNSYNKRSKTNMVPIFTK
jgi:hypothetical protein